MLDLIREAPFGQLFRYLFGNQILRYPEEEPEFKLPHSYQKALEAQHKDLQGPSIGSLALGEDSRSNKPRTSDQELGRDSWPKEFQTVDDDHTPKVHTDGSILVDFYTDDDPANTLNWSNSKRALVSAIICLYTFSISTASAVYTNSEPGIQSEFGVSDQVVYLGVSLYVLAYGIGPLFFAPLSEMPSIGRNPIYISTYLLFVILCVPVALSQNITQLLVLRFFHGLVGSPCFANGGASLTDLYSEASAPYAMAIWICAAYGGPALGPVLSAFAVPVEGWRWPFQEILWLSTATLVLFCFFLPETSIHTIRRHRAQRLRKLTGSDNFKSYCEVKQRHLTPKKHAVEALIRPIQISFKDPAVAFANFYVALVYGTYWSFFDAFPLVYSPMYRLSPTQTGLIFICIIFACVIGCASYALFVRLVLNRSLQKHGSIVPEQHLLPAVVASFLLPIGLLIFAWSSQPDIHWIVSVVGIVLDCAGVYTIIQCISMYISCTYPGYAASLFAANGFLRVIAAAIAIHFARPMFDFLGIGWGISIIAGVSLLGIVGILVMYLYGRRLREKSKYAVSW